MSHILLPDDIAALLEQYGCEQRVPQFRKNLVFAFADGVAVFELLHHVFPRSVPIHSISDVSNTVGRRENWALLNEKVFPVLGIELKASEIEMIIRTNVSRDAVIAFFRTLREKIASYKKIYKRDNNTKTLSRTSIEHLNRIKAREAVKKVADKISDEDIEKLYYKFSFRAHENNIGSSKAFDEVQKKSAAIDEQLEKIRIENLKELKQSEVRLAQLQVELKAIEEGKFFITADGECELQFNLNNGVKIEDKAMESLKNLLTFLRIDEIVDRDKKRQAQKAKERKAKKVAQKTSSVRSQDETNTNIPDEVWMRKAALTGEKKSTGSKQQQKKKKKSTNSPIGEVDDDDDYDDYESNRDDESLTSELVSPTTVFNLPKMNMSAGLSETGTSPHAYSQHDESRPEETKKKSVVITHRRYQHPKFNKFYYINTSDNTSSWTLPINGLVSCTDLHGADFYSFIKDGSVVKTSWSLA